LTERSEKIEVMRACLYFILKHFMKIYVTTSNSVNHTLTMHALLLWKMGKGAFKDYVEEILVDHLERISATLKVFSENYVFTMENAYGLLWTRSILN